MHVLHRPHLPRLLSVSIAAATVAIVISLALASSLSNIDQPGNTAGAPARHAAIALRNAVHMNAPRWVSNPFASLLSRPLPQPWLIARP